MLLDREYLINYIDDNYELNYFNTVDLLNENKHLLNKDLFIDIVKKLYFSYTYVNSKRSVADYCPLFDMTYNDFLKMEESILKDDREALPTVKAFLNFLTNEKVRFDLKNSYIVSKNIPEDYWYKVIIESIRYGDLYNISDFLLKHVKPDNFSFDDKYNFYNFIIQEKNILISKSKRDYINYIKLFKKIGFDINNIDVSGMSPLHTAIMNRKKQYIISLIKYSPKCDIFFDNNHLWNLYLEKFSHHEYNYNVYNYFLKNVPLESLKKDVGGYYLAGRILNKSGFGIATTDLIKKCFAFYNDKNSFKDKTIRERMIRHPVIGKMFRDEEMLYLETKLTKIMHIECNESPTISKRRL